MEEPKGLEGLKIGDAFPCFVVAEIGQNHQGQISIAKDMIRKAKECGANCVKFQKSSLTDKFTQAALEEEYRSENAFGRTYGEHKEALELSVEDFRELKDFAENKIGIMFSASAMDLVSAKFLVELGIPFIKVGSGDTNNYPLLEFLAESGRPVVLSTGMQEQNTVDQAVEILTKKNKEIVLLHCVSAYPTPFDDVNLSMIPMYKTKFPGLCVGYSGHEPGVSVSIAAVALGAKVVERHFTLDKSMKGTDHKCSLEPEEFMRMVQGIREVEIAIGQPHKTILDSELPCKWKLGKSLVAAEDLIRGTALDLSNIAIKVSRPMGIPPENIYDILGRKVMTDVKRDFPLTFDVLKDE